MSRDMAGTDRRSDFYTTERAIYCIAELTSGRDDVTVEGRWIANRMEYPDGTLVSKPVVIGTKELLAGKGENITVTFELEKQLRETYLSGSYECQLFIEDDHEETLRFDIRYPECPKNGAGVGETCAGYRQDTQCTAALGGLCKCSEAQHWECR